MPVAAPSAPRRRAPPAHRDWRKPLDLGYRPRMRVVGRGPLLVVVPLAASVFAAACSDDVEPVPDVDGLDAGDDVAAPSDAASPVDARGEDGASDAGAPCDDDLDGDGVNRHLSCTGLYSDIVTKAIAPSALAYAPAVPFWSDGAEKSRWLALPAGSTIDVSDFDSWKFPNGTRVWKEFKLDGKRVETRLYMKDAAGNWQHGTYRWNDDESEAIRKEGGESVVRAGKPTYEIPSAGQCEECHATRPGKLLGVDALQLGLPGAQGLTLAELASKGWLSATPPATSLVIPDDGTGKAAAALGWLHVNCGTCHTEGVYPSGIIPLRARIRPSQLLPDSGITTAQELDGYATTVCKKSTRAIDGGAGTYDYVAGGSPATSLVSILSGRRAPDGTTPTADQQMPPLVTRAVDTEGHAALDAWISALPPCP